MKKKILFMHPHLVMGGAETILINYLNIAASHPDYDVSLAVFNNTEQHNIEKIDPRVNIHFLATPEEMRFMYASRQIRDLSSSLGLNEEQICKIEGLWEERLKRLINLINKEEYDVVIDFLNIFKHYVTEEYRLQIKRPIIYWIHSDGVFGSWFSNYDEYKMILNKYDVFVSICEDMKKRCDMYVSHLFKINKESTMLFNPIDLNKIKVLANQKVSEEDSVLLEQPFILQVGRLDEYKNHQQMIDIYYKLKQKGIKEKLYIIGDGESEEQLINKIRTLGLENDCFILGRRKNPFPFMKKAKLFIHTSRFEGLPTALIESMICGTPVVAFNCPTGPREILADGKYGKLIPMGDEEQFVEAVYSLLTNEELRQYYINLLPEATARFSMEEIGHQFFTLINDVIPQKKSILLVYPENKSGKLEQSFAYYLNLLQYNPTYSLSILFSESKEKYDLSDMNKKVKMKFLLSDIEEEFLNHCSDKFLANWGNLYAINWYNTIKNEREHRLYNYIDESNFNLILDFSHHISDEALKGKKTILIQCEFSEDENLVEAKILKDNENTYNKLLLPTSSSLDMGKMAQNLWDSLEKIFR